MKRKCMWPEVLVVSLFAMVAIGGTSVVRTPYDYDGDGRSDLAVYDPAASVWYVLSSETSQPRLWNYTWGPAGARILDGDYNRDGQADLSKYDPATGKWYAHSLDSGLIFWGVQWGFLRARPVPADYNGDGKTDLAVYHRETGNWYIRDGVSDNVLAWGSNWGTAAMRPVPADYDGDGAADLAVYDELRGAWYIKTLQGQLLGWDIPWGFAGAIPVPGDYNGDGRADLAVYHLATGNWYIRTLEGTVLAWAEGWGFNGAIPVPGDYNGDGRTDLAVYHEATGNWYIRTIDGDVLQWARNWGYQTAVPLAKSSLNGYSRYREGPVTGPASLQGEWVGDYYHETVEALPKKSNVEPLFADVQHIRNYVRIRTTRPAVGGLLDGSIDQVGNMVLVDRYDGQTWTMPFGPAQYNQIKVYDFLFRPVPDVVSVLQVIDLVRY